MSVTPLSILMCRYKFWFYFRKGVFQIFLPVLLGFISICDYLSQTDDAPSKSYRHLYFYTLIILYLYASVKYMMEYIFSLCAEDVLFEKKLSLDKSSLSLKTSFTNTKHKFITIRKIFKIRYSKSKLFYCASKLCWYLGLDCPILIPYEYVLKLAQSEHIPDIDNCSEAIEKEIMYEILTNIESQKQQVSYVVPEQDFLEEHCLSPDKKSEYQKVVHQYEIDVGNLRKDLYDIDENM